MVTNFTRRWRGGGDTATSVTHLLAVPESAAIKGNDCENTDNAPTPQLAPPATTFYTVNTDIVCLEKQNSHQHKQEMNVKCISNIGVDIQYIYYLFNV